MKDYRQRVQSNPDHQSFKPDLRPHSCATSCYISNVLTLFVMKLF